MENSTYPPWAPYRKTRIVCVSDTHNQTPSLPKGDVLIHAGDLTNQGTLSEMKKTVAWLEKADFEVKIVVAGNHDITLDDDFYAENWASFHNQQKQDAVACQALLQNSPSITYLNHSSTHIKLTTPNGRRTHFKVFGSPYSPAHGLWAFGYQPSEAQKLWDKIPSDTDILITHTPPKGHCDTTVTKSRAGCEILRQALWRVRPHLAVCGHMHEGRGAEIIKWHTGALANVKFLDESVEYWEDPGAGVGNKKQSLVNLTAKSLNTPLNNVTLTAPRTAKNAAFSGEGRGTLPSSEEVGRLAEVDSYRSSFKASMGGGKKATLHALAERSKHDDGERERIRYSGGGDGGGGAVEGGRMRRETCVVNAAVMANSWGGAKRFNKVIVVDLDLPVWGDGDGEGELLAKLERETENDGGE
ncbi:Metallo-dependent phosphatase [Tothia fuscella]|uniref:Metallo-dependent phosphatase n=1 Tax=Tothia fuscella TaxID=1048955 RepID=A0A9P4NVS6_9PEZI|nr:Metallo-dependent phosphatase [Tothia fuscella]